VITCKSQGFIFNYDYRSFIMSKLTAKEKMLTALKQKSGYNTFTTKQAQRRFGITNVAARIAELRQEGYCIYTNTVTLSDGTKAKSYRLGSPSKAMVQAALRGGYSFAA